MIPYLLQFHGVRDFGPTTVRLGEVDEHILITGPNGVGKSTLTFIIGAILYSSKIDIEGLRSSNLEEQEQWNAKLTLVFKNEGATRIDGPKFIAFQLVIHQETKSGLIQKEYRILTGDREDELANESIYISGHTGGRNFGAYKEDLEIKYKISPDLYYLIWYQQEVNQFASMNPEERFRKFSDMFEITNMQKEWEAALESVKEVEREIQDLQSIVKTSRQLLRLAETERDRLLDNRHRIIEHGRKHYTYTAVLLEKYKQQFDDVKQSLVQFMEQQENLTEQEGREKETFKQLEEQQGHVSKKNEVFSEEIKQKDMKLEAYEQEKRALDQNIKQLTDQLQEISEQAKRLRYDEETTFAKLAETKLQISQAKKEKSQLRAAELEWKAKEKKTNHQTVRLEHASQQLRSQIVQAKEDIKRFKSTHQVNEQLHEANQFYHHLSMEKQRVSGEIIKIEQEIDQLKVNKIVSVRQEQGLKDLHQKNIRAYALRDLVEIAPGAPLTLEEMIETVKYTIFYDASTYTPLNDLYYVSLQKIVPTKVINELPKLGLTIRSGLSNTMQNHANRVLWWIDQFFITTPEIKGNILIDARGSRGPQEEKQYILSDEAIQRSLQAKQKVCTRLQVEREDLERQHQYASEQIDDLHSHLRTIKEAESILLQESKLMRDEEELKNLQAELLSIYDQQTELENQISEQNHVLSSLQFEWDQLQTEARIYEEIGAQAEQQIKLENYKKELQSLKQTIFEEKATNDQLRNTLDDHERSLQNIKRSKRNTQEAIESTQAKLKSVSQKLTEADEQKDQLDAQISEKKMKHEELTNILPEEARVVDVAITSEWSEIKLLSADERAEIGLQFARTEKVDIHAEKNYEAMKEDYEQKHSELTKSEILLETNKTRATETEDQLETTIHMYLTQINMLFQKYMDIFQFEGLIEKERVEEKSGRIKYLLYVKARKIGHRGSMEDVSLKARHGKVGKGVSGGEESLSSLLFALALMQNLSISPSYIILDEFDSALDDDRKDIVFQLYANELNRKLIILSPKAHDESYYNYFSKVFVIEHDPITPQSTLSAIEIKK